MTKNKRWYFKLLMHDGTYLFAGRTWPTYEEALGFAKTTHTAMGSRSFEVVEYNF